MVLLWHQKPTVSIGKWDFLSFVSVFAAASADAVSARTVAAQNEFLLHGAIMPGFHTVNCRAFLFLAALITWGVFLTWRIHSLPLEKGWALFSCFIRNEYEVEGCRKVWHHVPEKRLSACADRAFFCEQECCSNVRGSKADAEPEWEGRQCSY